eukprot:m.96276 g.96276  ORF g.96276 m.96276 type:complete len:216 (+) comp18473_c0_seq4:65-712(+)
MSAPFDGYADLQGPHKMYATTPAVQAVQGRYQYQETASSTDGAPEKAVTEDDYLVPGNLVDLSEQQQQQKYESLGQDHYDQLPNLTQGRPEPPARAGRAASVGRAQPAPPRRLEDTVSSSIGKEDADRILAENRLEDGLYVLRKSRSHPGSFVLVVAAQFSQRHYPVERLEAPYEGMLSVICPGTRRRFSTLQEVVDHYSAKADGIAAKLTRRVA